MNESSADTPTGAGDAVEALLARAIPRPAPPADVLEDVRRAIRPEWQRLVAARRRRARLVGFAIAAAVTLVVAVPLVVLRESGVAPVRVARIALSHGTFYLQGTGPALAAATDGMAVEAGQTLTTTPDAAVALAWHDGGSLRVDRNTKVEFVTGTEVFLHTGRVYVDSAAAAADSHLYVRTPHGVVTHIGTQYLAESTPAGLIVSVREGRVEIDGIRHDQTVVEGQRAEIYGDGPAAVTNTSGTGADWEWAESVAPRAGMQGKSTYEFLQWVARETGNRVQFTTAAAEQLARETRLIGEIEGDPRSELRLRMMTVDLEARIDPGTRSIIVSGTR